MGVLWAHSANRTGARHRLEDHLAGTAALARGFGEPFGAGDLAGYLGLVHDVGKAACAWQAGLAAAEDTRNRVGTDHKRAGTWLASRTAGVFAATVDGHHGGLPAAAALKNELSGADAGLRLDGRRRLRGPPWLCPPSGRVGRLPGPPGWTPPVPEIRW
jgi:CRISPR-associated endonuclease/helicase Cas3